MRITVVLLKSNRRGKCDGKGGGRSTVKKGVDSGDVRKSLVQVKC